MYVQSQIHSQLSSPRGLEQVQSLLSSETFETRTAVGRAVCELFDFKDAGGQLQQASCMKSLRRLEHSGQVMLPESRGGGSRGQARGTGEPVPPAQQVPGRVDQLSGLRLTRVADRPQRQLWNELMAREHPRGAAVHAGCQLRYFIESDHGILGGFGFAASALTLRARDQWMGWDAAQRGMHLHRVVGLSRFLIRPQVRCANLASKALGMALRRLPADFERCYGYRPFLVETFINPVCYDGASLRASNWTHVGQTAGRGRMSSAGAAAAVKSVYLYEVERGWRDLLGVADPFRIAPRGAGEGLDSEQWADHELGAAPLGDKRLSKRLVKSASLQAAAPMSSFPAAAVGDKAAVYGHYRLIDQPADSEVTPCNILAPHRQRTLARMQGCAEVLCVQDGTDLNFADHGECKGMGLISRNKSSMGTLGIHMHSQLVLNEAGVPLGVPHIQYDSLPKDGRREADENKMGRWRAGLRECSALAAQLDGVRVVSVMDREGDSFELYALARQLGNVEVLTRAAKDRVLGHEWAPRDGKRVKQAVKLFDKVRGATCGGELEIHMGQQSARRPSRGQPGKVRREQRTAAVELRWMPLELPVPVKATHLKGESPVKLNAVHVLEPSPPAGLEAVEWLLLTTLPVDSFEQAEQVIERYRLRWRIEDWHRVLKSGCKVEFLSHRSCDRIERAVTIKAVIAWRLAAMVLMGRETPELPPEVLFSDIEIAVLEDFARDNRLAEPDDLGTAVRTMAIMGGYLNRRKDPPPGYKKIWEGYTRLSTMAQAYELMVRLGPEGGIYRLMRPD